MRLAFSMIGIRLLFVVGLVAFLLTLPLSWFLDAVDEHGERFPLLDRFTGRVEFMFKGLSMWCAHAEARAHALDDG
jgi:hypothetical protein